MTKRKVTREALLRLCKASDRSRDWRDWSAAKCGREREKNPEIDAALSSAEADLHKWLANHDTALRLVDEGYKPGSTLWLTAVCAALAAKFNMRPDEVRALPLNELYGLVRAYSKRETGKQTGQSVRYVSRRWLKAQGITDDMIYKAVKDGDVQRTGKPKRYGYRLTDCKKLWPWLPE